MLAEFIPGESLLDDFHFSLNNFIAFRNVCFCCFYNWYVLFSKSDKNTSSYCVVDLEVTLALQVERD